MLDEGLVDWPTKEEVAYEDLAMELLNGNTVELQVGVAPATGRRRILEFSLDGGWRLAYLPPEKPETTDTMGAPDFPLPDPWSQPPRMEPTLAPDLQPRPIADDPQA
jgi:hypothetical protein